MAPLWITSMHTEHKLESWVCSSENNTDLVRELTVQLSSEDNFMFEKNPDGNITIRCVFGKGYQLVLEKDFHLEFGKKSDLNQTFVLTDATFEGTTPDECDVIRKEIHTPDSVQLSADEVPVDPTDNSLHVVNTGNMISLQNTSFSRNTITVIQQTKSYEPPGPVNYGFPQSVEMFGREKEIEEISDKIERGVAVAITGLAITGKTTLAMECARRWTRQEDTAVRDMALLDATDQQTFSQSIRGLAQVWNLKIRDLNTSDVLNSILSCYVRGNRKLLLVYDNMGEFIAMKDFVFDDKKNVLLLGTTQNKEIGKLFFCVTVDSLSKEDSKQLLKYRILEENFFKIEKKSLNNLITKLDRLPLVLLLCAAYIEQELSLEYEVNDAINEYIVKFETYLELEKHEKIDENYEKLYTALKMNIERLGRNSLHVLCSLSYLDTAHIRMDIVQELQRHLRKFGLYREEEEDIAVNRGSCRRRALVVIKDLKKYSLLKAADNKEEIEVREVIAIVCRKMYTDNAAKYVAALMLSLSGDGNCLEHYTRFFQLCSKEILQQAFQLFLQNQQNERIIKNINENTKVQKYELVLPEIETWHLLAHLVYGLKVHIREHRLFDLGNRHTGNLMSLIKILKHKYKNIVSSVDMESWKLLHISSLVEGCVECLVECLPELRDGIDEQTNMGLTALHVSALFAHWSNVHYLMNLGCDVNLADKAGNTAAQLAFQHHQYDIIVSTALKYNRCVICNKAVGKGGAGGRCVWCTTVHQLNEARGECGGYGCPNNQFGCKYSHSDWNMALRHGYKFCTYRDVECVICGKSQLGTRHIDHYIREHCTELKAKVLDDVAVTRFTLPLADTGAYHYVTRVNGMVFYVQVDPPGRGADRRMYLLLDTETRGYHRLDISYTVTSNETFSVLTSTLDRINGSSDWGASVKLNEFKKSDKSFVCIELTIKVIK